MAETKKKPVEEVIIGLDDEPPKPKLKKVASKKKAPTPKKKTRRTRSQVAAAVKRVDALIAGGTSKTVACAEEKLNVTSYNNFKSKGVKPKPVKTPRSYVHTTIHAVTTSLNIIEEEAVKLRALGLNIEVVLNR
jgi:hypothetical protein